MKKNEMIPNIIWIGVGIFVMSYSYKLGIEEKLGAEEFHNPGPGLMPFIVGLFLFLISLYYFIKYFLEKESRVENVDKGQNQSRFGKIIIVLAALFGYIFLLDKLGYLITTFSFLTCLFWRMGSIKIKNIMIISAITSLISYFGFTYLGLIFPEGILKVPGF